MSEDTYVVFNLKNETGDPITHHSSPLAWGKWVTSPPGQVGNGDVGTFKASGAKGSATGTQGSVTYLLPDNVSTITISFDVPYTASNQGGISGGGSGISSYCFQETDSTYKKINSFPTSGNPTTYWYVGLPGKDCPSSTSASSKSFLGKVRQLSSCAPLQERIDIATAAWWIGSGCIEGPVLVELFGDSCWGDVLGILDGHTFLEQRIDIAAHFGLFSPRDAYHAALDFAEQILPVLDEHPRIQAHALAAIRLLRAAEIDGQLPEDDGANPGRLTRRLRQASATLQIASGFDGARRQLAAIDAVLASLTMEPHHALAHASICARLTAENEEHRRKIAYEQHANLIERASSYGSS